MKSYLKFIALICTVAVSTVLLSACADNTPPPASTPAPEPVKPNS